jgi:site-specific DNA recombinase
LAGENRPKVAQLKVKLERIEGQIDESKRYQSSQLELFLVINRLEEFASAVHEQLNTIDFNTKREIIRALVKRIEIHKEGIVVVFRVEPGSGNGTGARSNKSEGSAQPPTGALRGPIRMTERSHKIRFFKKTWSAFC